MPCRHRNERFQKARLFRRQRDGGKHIAVVEIFIGKSGKQRFDAFFGLFCFVVTDKERTRDVIDRYLVHPFLDGQQILRKHCLTQSYFGFVVSYSDATRKRMPYIKIHRVRLCFCSARFFLLCFGVRVLRVFFYRFEKSGSVVFEL